MKTHLWLVTPSIWHLCLWLVMPSIWHLCLWLVMPSIWPLPLVCAALWYVLPAKHRLARALTKARRACTLVCASRQNRLARALTKARRACTLVCASRQNRLARALTKARRLALWYVLPAKNRLVCNPPLVSDTFHGICLWLVTTFHLASLPLTLVSDTCHLASGLSAFGLARRVPDETHLWLVRDSTSGLSAFGLCTQSLMKTHLWLVRDSTPGLSAFG